MSFTRYLRIAGVPQELHQEALNSLHEADQRSAGVLWAKFKTRLLMPGKIAKLLPWDAERLADVKPEWASHDIAPMLNISAQGDNGPWADTPDGGRPLPGAWLNPDPDSAEYKEAVSQCYWSPGNHPRSTKARKAWYRRNGGEYLVWSKGLPVDTALPVQRWAGQDGRLSVQVVRCGECWIVVTRKRLLGRLVLDGRYGFEIDNVFCGPGGAQAWFPAPGYELRAPVTWGSRPRWAA